MIGTRPETVLTLLTLLPLKPNYFKKQCFLSSFFLPKVIIEVQSGNGVLKCLDKTSLKIFKHYKLKPSFSIIKDEKAKDKVGVGDKPPLTSFNNLIKFDQI